MKKNTKAGSKRKSATRAARRRRDNEACEVAFVELRDVTGGCCFCGDYTQRPW